MSEWNGDSVAKAGPVPRRSPLAMAILLLLTLEPLHPYGLRQRVQEWDKDRVINVTQRNAIYHTIDRLRAAGLITLRETERQDNRPDRSIYQATESGVALGQRWLAEMLSTPAYEFPEFPAALAFLLSLPPVVALTALGERTTALETNIKNLKDHVAAQVAQVPGGVDRIYLIEVEYQQTMWEAELQWLQTLLADIRDGRAWTTQEGAPVTQQDGVDPDGVAIR